MPLLRCPVCGKSFQPDQTPAMPFCGHRCRQIDLGRWLGEQYRVPIQSQPQSGEPADTPPDPPAADL